MDIRRLIICLLMFFCLHAQASTIVISTVPKLPVFTKIQNHLQHAYSLMGYDVEFIPMLLGRGSMMANNGLIDGVSVRVPAIEQVAKNLIRVPVMILSGDLSLYCSAEVVCDESVLSNEKLLVGGLSNVPVMQSFMSDKAASLYLVHDAPQLKALFNKGRIQYILSIEIDGFGNFQALDMHPNRTTLLPLEGYHYVHKQHALLVPHIAQSLLESQAMLGQIYP